MRTVLPWKFLLPIAQAMLAVALWLYIPVQYRKEILKLAHKPAEHPFRFRLEGSKPRLFPPGCEQLLHVINFPAFSVSRRLVDPLIYHIEFSQQAGLGEGEFTLPVRDPEALPPRRILYVVYVNQMVFLGLVAMLWWWVGFRIDEYLRNRMGAHTQRHRVFRILELVVLVAILVLSVFTSYLEIVEAQSPQGRHVGMVGLIWPAVLLAYIWLAARHELQERNGLH